MYRDQYNLYVSNIADRTDEERLIAFFSQFGKIESFTYLKKNGRRSHPAALITYASCTDLDAIVERNQRVELDDHTLSIRRTLPATRPAFERYMSSNELLVSLPALFTDEQFNESSLRSYFSKYGSIVSCRILIPSRTFLIDFVNNNSVNRAILDEPHFYNETKLILRKYVPTNRIGLSQMREVPLNGSYLNDRFVLMEKLRRLEDGIEATRFGQQVELQLTKCSYERKKSKLVKKEDEELIRLRRRSEDRRGDVQRLKDTNGLLTQQLENSQRVKRDLIRSYAEKLDNERKRTEQLQEVIALLQCL